jgi:hypothetical protein
MKETKIPSRLITERRKVFARRFEQNERAYYIRVNERAWVIYRAIYMSFGCEVQNRRWPVFAKDRLDCIAVGYIAFDKDEARIFKQVFERAEISRICQLVEHNNSRSRARQSVANEVGSDESRTARYND